ncbi:MAG: polymer-forming cytoskeletal protein [Caldilineaceae bacterium]|nr:polymer-forming cytoskeletal protein [Caldilineaceae bacterium]
MKRLSENRIWFLAAIVMTLATLGILFSPAALADDGPAGRTTGMRPLETAIFSPDQQIFNNDLLVESGQTIAENVTVFRGNVVIEEGGAIRGDLSVLSGNVTLAGTLDGDLAVIGGNVDLRDTARVTGDVSVVGGRLTRAPNAFIGGNFVGGPRTQIQERANERATPEVTVRVNQPQRPWILVFLFRLLQAVLWTLLVTGLVVLLAWLFPKPLREIRQTGVDQPALSFAVGLVVSLATLMVGGLLFITVCLIPFSLLLWGLLAIVALVGWAVIAMWLGERIAEIISQRSGPQLHPLIPVTLGALLLTGISFFAWSLLPCLGLIVAVLLGSTGVGAVLVYLARRSNFSGGAWSGGSRGDGPASPGTPPSGSAVTVVRQPVDVPVVETPTENYSVVAETTATGIAPEDEAPVVERPVVDEESGFLTGEELGLSDEERHQLRQGAGMAANPDDFLKIRGIGPAFNRKLLAAGITTYRQLAATSPEEIAAIVGWAPERVIRDQLREQAADLAEQG